VTLMVDDSHGGTATQSYAIRVEQEAGNHPPVIVSEPVTTAVPGQTYRYDVDAVDPDSDPLAFLLTSAPAGMTIDPASGLVSWTPSAAQAGSYAVTVRVEDGRGGFDTQSFTIDVGREPPGEIRGTKFNDLDNDADRDRGAELLINGNFEAGNIGFSTDYHYSPNSILGFEQYAITSNPRLVHNQATSFGDHTSGSGLMMAVNGPFSSNNLTVWAQTVSVQANTTYSFSAWVSSWTNYPPESNALLDFSINGRSLGTFRAPSPGGIWKEFCTHWDSRSDTTASIRIVVLNPGQFIANDFALDDLSFIAIEPGLPGWTIYIDDNGNNRRDLGERFTTTDDCGNYSFTNLAPGT
jgi:hypothetical protein